MAFIFYVFWKRRESKQKVNDEEEEMVDLDVSRQEVKEQIGR
jgi:hypothetical protein